MARIGTWRKIEQNRTDFFVYENNIGTRILIFLANKIMFPAASEKTPYWGTEVRDKNGATIKYLGGGSSGIYNTTKSKAFKVARQYMQKHPGNSNKGKAKEKHKLEPYGRSGRERCSRCGAVMLSAQDYKTECNPTGINLENGLYRVV